LDGGEWGENHSPPKTNSRLEIEMLLLFFLGGWGVVYCCNQTSMVRNISRNSQKLRHSNGKCLGSIRTKASIYYISLSPSLSSALNGCRYIHIYIYHISIIYKHLDSQLIWLLLLGIFLLNHISSEWTFFKQRTSFWIPYEIPAVQNSI